MAYTTITVMQNSPEIPSLHPCFAIVCKDKIADGLSEHSKSLCLRNLEHGVFGQRFPHGGKWKLSRLFADCLTTCAAPPRSRPQTGASKPRTTVPDQEARSRPWSETSGCRQPKESRTEGLTCTASSVAPRSRVAGSWRRVLVGSATIHNAIARIV
ncbi:hypothetical protein BDP81DRAFT_166256 [Colletotrichum phormii]|uniref:Uncharacterized protein n=1 Tax=Colletotrichum phormii TaxID=359342 RepID=A0AAI9ZZF7_9PEZI|nr:uncharacterized protein BDP81DRAFT_166256 [Colletotrichum phormii]KAK1640635.1 hypothetical protein BDP81DRAFT_166256 [Colletotrichum phormii]